jgi:hypothetical protein
MLRGRTVLKASPVKQTMRIKGVVDVLATFGVEGIADCSGAGFDVCLGRTDLSDCFAIFLGEVFKHLLAAAGHLGVQFERLKMNLHGDGLTYIFDGDFQAAQSNRAPRACNIRDVVDFDGHARSRVRKGL